MQCPAALRPLCCVNRPIRTDGRLALVSSKQGIFPLKRLVVVRGTGFGSGSGGKGKGDPKPNPESAPAPEISDEGKKDAAAKVDILDEPELAIEAKLRERRKSRPSRKVNVVSPMVEEIRSGGPTTEEAQFESNVVSLLFFLFGLIFLEGLFLAAAGFLPEGVDDFALNVVYPAFSPTVGVFLLCSSFYGVWKTRTQKGEEEG
ncbi:hypothetical protein BSKO_00439 [Bryopsis sp. KO-2023]|nr:hypothetical protein BSKO_00439 [Bryopsis sp. KO-2023]